MKDQFDDYDKRIMEKVDQEAEEIERMIRADSEIASIRADANLDAKVYESVSAYEDGVAGRRSPEPEDAKREVPEDKRTFANLTDEELEALYLGREVLERRRKRANRRAAWKAAGKWKHIAAVFLIFSLTAGVGVTSVGGAERIVEMVKGTLGGRDSTKVNSSRKPVKETDDSAEEKAYQQIKDELGIDPVRILGFSGGVEFRDCEVDSESRMARLLYAYGDRNVSYLVDASYTEELWGTDIEDKKLDDYIYTLGELSIVVTEYQIVDSREKRYSGEFEYNGIYYQLTGTMTKKKFEKILKNLYFS
ncbi:MAG: DUF4367 domain-containing protein [Dorea sp.]|nr:DUF4367 domain-containing protein [Dorea sp.]